MTDRLEEKEEEEKKEEEEQEEEKEENMYNLLLGTPENCATWRDD